MIDDKMIFEIDFQLALASRIEADVEPIQLTLSELEAMAQVYCEWKEREAEDRAGRYAETLLES